MKRTMLFALLLLAGCGEDRAAAPTAEQADQLNEAEDLLDQESEADNQSGAGPRGD